MGALTVPRILVVADDLSGAADCGIAFVRSGLSTVVMFSGDATPVAAADTLALDADSRHLPQVEAAAIHQRLVRRHLSDGVLLYKKIDSTLRGNIAAELAAVIPLAGTAIVAPAFPDTGRTTRDGRVHVNDVPLEATEIWQREKLTGVADIAAMLAQAGVRPVRVGLSLVRAEQAALQQALESMAQGGANAIVCDAETNQDLGAIATASARMTCRHFWVGSAGLAHHLAPAAGIVATPASPVTIVPGGPVLVAVGSLSAVSRGQARRLAQEPSVASVIVASEALRKGEFHPAWQIAASALETALRSRDDVLLAIDTGDKPDLSEGWALCEALGRLVLPFAGRLGAVVATGGETARALLTAMGAAGLRLAYEIEPGVVQSTTEGGRRLPVVTKAGAFGTPETLVHCRAVLHGTAARLES